MPLEFIKTKSNILLFVALLTFALFSSVLVASVALKYNNDHSLSLLAAQFLKGHISLEPTADLPVGDISKYNGKFYIYFGPLASLILMPFVAFFGKGFSQLAIGVLSLSISFVAIYSISRYFKFEKLDSLWLSLFFVFSTVLFSTSLINITSYLVEALGVPLILLSLACYFSKKRIPILIGLFIGLAIMTRITLIFAVIFFFIEFIKKRITRKELMIILIPVMISCVILASYNFLRFDSFFETGYNYHIGDPFPLSENAKFGWTSLIHVPANLYVFFLKPPEPLLHNLHGYVFLFPYLKADPWGMAIWFTSPLFLMLLFHFRKNKYFTSAVITTVCIALPIVTFYSVGFAQFGYRYALDFLPFLFILLVPSLLPKLTKTAIILIIIGVLFNCIYTTSLWGVYPHFLIF